MKALRKGLADDYSGGCAVTIVRVEDAAAAEWNSERSKVLGADHVGRNVDSFMSREANRPVPLDFECDTDATDRQSGRGGEGFDSWCVCDAIEDATVQGGNLAAVILRRRRQ